MRALAACASDQRPSPLRIGFVGVESGQDVACVDAARCQCYIVLHRQIVVRPMRLISLFLAACIVSPTLHAGENLLVGTWRSDAAATMSFNRAHARLEERQDRFLASLMGKMTLEFTDEELHLLVPETRVAVQDETKSFAGYEERKPYKVLFCNACMAVIETTEAVTGEEGVTTYFFVGDDSMWTYVGTNSPKVPDLHIREYFKRVQ